MKLIAKGMVLQGSIPCPWLTVNTRRYKMDKVLDSPHYKKFIQKADGESYRDFIDEIYDNTRGHNEPLRVQIRNGSLWVEEDEEEAE